MDGASVVPSNAEQGSNDYQQSVNMVEEPAAFRWPARPGPVLVAQPARNSVNPFWARSLAARRQESNVSNNRVRYPPRFKALAAVVLGLSASWILDFLLIVRPTIEEHQDSPCRYEDSQLTYKAKTLFTYFSWFTVARFLLLVPCVANHVTQVQPRTHGLCRTYLVHLVLRDGPLYIFVFALVLFWFHLLQSPSCESKSPKLHGTLKTYAMHSAFVSIFCIVLSVWHNKLLSQAMRETPTRYQAEDCSAPAHTITSLKTQAYDSTLFGNADDKLYPAECAICLLDWELEDAIKVTPCGHVFHEECLGHWLRTARTCALCRQDLTRTESTPQAQHSPQSIGANV